MNRLSQTGRGAAILTILVAVPSYLLFLVAYLTIVDLAGGLGLRAYLPVFLDFDMGLNPVGEGAAANWIFNSMLVALFTIQHTVMARAAFKARIVRIIPAIMERAVFVLVSSLLILFITANWQAAPGMVWSVENDALRIALWIFFAAGFLLVPYASLAHDHFEFFGLRQGFDALAASPAKQAPFLTPWLYRQVRHPMMTGFLMGLWLHPDMSRASLGFAILLTLYIFIGIRFEERSLVAKYGTDYQQYRQEVPALIPSPFRKG